MAQIAVPRCYGSDKVLLYIIQKYPGLIDLCKTFTLTTTIEPDTLLYTEVNNIITKVTNITTKVPNIINTPSFGNIPTLLGNTDVIHMNEVINVIKEIFNWFHDWDTTLQKTIKLTDILS